jgi:hypothetical protein
MSSLTAFLDYIVVNETIGDVVSCMIPIIIIHLGSRVRKCEIETSVQIGNSVINNSHLRNISRGADFF